MQRKPEPPWQFELRRVPDAADDFEADDGADGSDDGGDDDGGLGWTGPADGGRTEAAGGAAGGAAEDLERLYCHVLDWQAPRNYVFVPRSAQGFWGEGQVSSFGPSRVSVSHLLSVFECFSVTECPLLSVFLGTAHATSYASISRLGPRLSARLSPGLPRGLSV